MDNTNIERIYPLTSLQEGMLYHRLIDEASNDYFVQSTIRFSGELDEGIVEKSLVLLSKKHPVLRTSIFHKKVKQPRQIVLKDRAIGFAFVDLSHLSSLAREEHFAEIKRDDVNNHFDLEKDPLMRVSMVKMEENEHRMIWSFHHIIMDGWCMSLVMKDFIDNYMSLSRGVSMEALARAIETSSRGAAKYEDYIKWLAAQDKGKALNYWGSLLSDYEQEAGIRPLGRATEIEKQVEKGKLILSKEVSEKITQISHQFNVTMNTVVEAAWGILLQSFNGTDDTVFGKVVSGRNANVKDIESVVGLFINTIPVRVNNTCDLSCIELIQQLQEQAFESSLYDYCSLPEIQEQCVLKEKLIQTLLAFENYYVEEELYEPDSPNLTFEVESTDEQTSYPISLIVYVEDTLRLDLLFNPGMYSRYEIERLLECLRNILTEMAEAPDKKISKMEVISRAEKEQIVHEFNRTQLHFSNEKALQQLFEEQVSRTPQHIALVYKNVEMTYEELNQQANRLARFLKTRNSTNIVGILVGRKPEMLISMLAVLKSGAAYLPIDPEYPTDRILHMLEDSNAHVILTEKGMWERLDLDFHGEIIDVMDEGSYDSNHSNFIHSQRSDELAYVIYTSGSTGKPKGVMIQHSSVHNLIEGISSRIRFTEGKSILNLSTISFDIFVIESLLPLVKGMRVVIMDEYEQKDSISIREAIKQHHIHILQTTPSRMKVLISGEFQVEQYFHSVQEIIVTGEALPNHLAEQLKQTFSCEIYNMYGPTETTVWSAMQNVRSEERVTIGKPIANTRAYILNRHRSILPIGVPGELCISGEGIARGYLNRPELTEEKFVDNPYAPGERMYRTGDLARWLPDGNIEYLGRMDEQVKIRGYRIELGEIEHAIRRLAGIRDAAVIAREDQWGDKYICAYVVGEVEGNEVDVAQIKSELAKLFPSYMLPAYFHSMNELPVTTNGKLNKRALPEPELRGNKDYAAPRNQMEASVVTVFKDVLNLEQVSIHDSFFELGGHSLKATRVVNAIESTIGTRIPLRVLFERSSVAELAEYLKHAQENTYEEIPPAEQKQVYPMSPTQRRMYLIHAMEELGTAYHMPGVMELEGPFDLQRMKKVIQQLTDRHEALRTSFHLIEGEPVQRIEEQVEVEVVYEEIAANEAWFHAEIAVTLDAAVEPDQERSTIAARLLQGFVCPFDLSKAPLLRVKVVKTASDRHLLLFDMHHIISDGATMNLFTREFSQLYNGQSLATNDIQYKDYSEWISKRDLSHQEDFWMKQFDGEIPVLELPLDYPRLHTQQFSGASIEVNINEVTKQQVQDLCRKSGATEYMVLLSSLMVLLNKYSRQEDIVVGSPVSGRTHRATEHMVGMFVNTLALRGQPEEQKSFIAFLDEMKHTCLNAFENQEYPFEALVEKVNVQRELSRHPLFDVMFVLQDEQEEWTADGLQLKVVEVPSSTSKFDLSIIVNRTQHGYTMTWEYCDKLFHEETIRRMAAYYDRITAEVIADPYQAIRDIDVLTQVETQQILVDFNFTKTLYPHDKTIVQLLEEQVISTPNAEAIKCPNEVLTYEQLDRRSNEMMGELKRNGVQPGQLIGIVCEKSTQMIAGIIAILKCGCGYVPLDADYPDNRLRFMIEDCDIKTILAPASYLKRLEMMIQTTGRVIDMHKPYKQCTGIQDGGSSQDVAYVIYTSGSTGLPKGVVVNHQNVVRLVKHTNYVDFNQIRVLQTGALSFDAATFEIWGALLNGGSLCFAEQDTMSEGSKLASAIEQHDINTIWMTTQLFNHLMDTDVKWLARLRTVLIGGEKISKKHAKKLLACNGDVKLINCYGPTENTTFSLTFHVDQERANIPIGRPISNSTAYILNGDVLCGIGMPGELCVGGDGVADGYLNREDLTESKFVENPYVSGERMYRTGDLARWLPDGNIEYLGRMDEQVKIRGYRIELGEIESALRKQAGIKDAVVLAQENEGNLYLCAYVVSIEPEQKVNREELKNALRKELPEYMIPAYFVSLDQLPVTINGKLDRRALPEPELSPVAEYAAPRDEVEQMLASIFSEVLGIERIGIDDGFFDLGGDSIKAIRIISKIREHRYALEVKTLLQEKDIRHIRHKVERLQLEQLEEYQRPVEGIVKWTPIQHLFHEWKLSKPSHFNQAVIIHSAEQLDTDRIKAALHQLVIHHDALRSQFDEKGTQRICDVVETDFFYEFHTFDYREIHDQGAMERVIEEQCNLLQASIDIKKGPLMKSALFQAYDGEYLFICIHHLVVDGVSWRILLEDFSTVYTQLSKDEELRLPLKTASYPLWAESLIQYGQSYQLLRELDYWKTVSQHISCTESISQAHVVHGSHEVDSAEVKEINEIENQELRLSIENTNKLLYECGTAYNTEINDLLLAALSIALHNCYRIDRVGVEMESHGRHPIEPHISIDRTVGWFTNVYPILLQCQSGQVGTTIKQTKEMLRAVPNQGLGYGVLKYLADREIRGQLSPVDLEVSFNYLGDISHTEGGIFTFSTLSCGKMSSDENKIHKQITLDGIVQNGQLTFTIGVNHDLTNDENSSFCKAFEQALLDVIAHCSNLHDTEYTASDYGDAIEWSDSELDDVLKLFEGDEDDSTT